MKHNPAHDFRTGSDRNRQAIRDIDQLVWPAGEVRWWPATRAMLAIIVIGVFLYSLLMVGN